MACGYVWGLVYGCYGNFLAGDNIVRNGGVCAFERRSHKEEILMLIERKWAMPNKNTFKIKPIAKLLKEEIKGFPWIDPFANISKLADVTNDLNPEFDTDYHLEAFDFLQMFDFESIHGVLFDPPYSVRQITECYRSVGKKATQETTRSDWWTRHKKEIARIVEPGGKVISFGWNSGGIGKSNGFTITRILLVPHGGIHNDTIVTVEIKER